jgi:type VI secretion system ImpM family protein
MIWGLLRKREAAPLGPVLLGKLPCQPDFVREGFRGPASDALDAFLVQAAPILHQGVGVAQLPALLVCQSLPRQAHALFGLCVPSRDAAGRPFPVAIVHALEQAQLRAVQGDVFWRFPEFVHSARALLAQVETLTLADTRQELNELAELTPSDSQRAADGGSDMPPIAAFERGLGSEQSADIDAQSYALYAIASAFAARHPGLTLDCPAQDASQARLWLTLTARVAEVSASSLCILYAPLPGRLLIAIDAWHPGQLRAIADPGFSFDQLWPLATPQAEARAHARSALAQAGAALARPRSASLRELADQLAQFSLGLRG